MAAASSVSTWIKQLKSGDLTALAKIHRRYWPHMMKVAGRRLVGNATRYVDEEDAAQEALLGFYHCVQNGGFPQLSSRQDLLAVLSFITARKAAHLNEFATRQKRGGGRLRGESAFGQADTAGEVAGIDQVAAEGVAPSELACLRELYEQYLAILPPNLRQVGELYLAGYTYREIASMIGCVPRTVERKVPLVLARWRELASQMLDEPQP